MENKFKGQEETSQPIDGEMNEAELDGISGGIKSPNQLGDMSQTNQMKMQMVVDRKTKADSTASNLLKKLSDTASSITSNLK